MLKVAICDDEIIYRKRVEALLVERFSKENISYRIHLFSTVDEVANSSDLAEYDVLFLDIQIDDGNGIELAKQLRDAGIDSFIVFVTSFSNYVFEGYKVEAVRYILKNSLELMFDECLDFILKKLKLYTPNVTFNFIGEERKIKTNRIVYIESERHLLNFYILENTKKLQQYKLYSKLDAVEELLSNAYFLRIHKSYLVNMRFITYFNNYTVRLGEYTEIHIPRARYQEARGKYISYKGEE